MGFSLGLTSALQTGDFLKPKIVGQKIHRNLEGLQVFVLDIPHQSLHFSHIPPFHSVSSVSFSYQANSGPRVEKLWRKKMLQKKGITKTSGFFFSSRKLWDFFTTFDK